jgi:hypothetical protein
MEDGSWVEEFCSGCSACQFRSSFCSLCFTTTERHSGRAPPPRWSRCGTKAGRNNHNERTLFRQTGEGSAKLKFSEFGAAVYFRLAYEVDAGRGIFRPFANDHEMGVNPW